ncbi:MAG: hypothetical protein JRI68_15935 [Deltaproteobacteria bacterium]|nr:hypothetical protein [Deltaproteobacteria bacterium]
MKRLTSSGLAVGALLSWLVACGGGNKPADEPSADDSGSDSAAAEPTEGGSDTAGGDDEGTSQPSDDTPKGLPTACANDDGDLCLPPKKFVLALCDGEYPSVGLWLFNQGSPWVRGYLRGKTRAVYASASGGSTGEMMSRGEEVLVLRKHGASNPGGIVVSGSSGAYDVMRWDGSCATLETGFIQFDGASNPGNARIVWGTLEYDVREALKEDETVRQAYITLRKECKGVTMGDVSAKCEKADGALSKLLAKHVRENGGVPVPKKVPEL